ncbi:hypothetical protein [Azospirillum picis]|uniref:Uncharacterized protein n=1 Tax=Azospirillum picis TaxID=488438 RepID=A0ABU0MEB3_9PROT|nr:hypothetical protein [Azospirillum picis]MBP2297937.1 hypothetical protein [Azospirillum picis]MDQ0531775.1 hypothetical protein [Azospirillum picis]
MTGILTFLGTRAGGVAALVLGGLLMVVVGALGVSLWLTRSDLADERVRADTLESAVRIQNDAVMDWQEKAAAFQSAAEVRALKALTPRPKPNITNVEELNAWLALPR